MAETLMSEFDGINLDEDSDVDENYEDVEESFEPITEMDLQSSMETGRRALILYINDAPDKAEEIITPLWKTNVYHALGKASVAGAKGFMTFNKSDMEEALEIVKECTVVINRRRHKGSLTNNMVTKMVIRPNYNTYTEEEVHAELGYAETLIFRAFLVFFQDGNVLSYVKGGLKIRKAYQVYRECQEILEHRTNWSNEKLRLEFESGVDIGIGVFNLIVASLPPRLSKFLSFFGFSGDKEMALQRLYSGHKKASQTIRGFLCTFSLFIHTTLVRYLVGYPQMSASLLEYCEDLKDTMLKECQVGAAAYVIKGRMELLKGNIDAAVNHYDGIMQFKFSIGNLNHIPALESAFLFMILGKWRKSVACADLLCRECPWLKGLLYYMKGIGLFMCDDRTDVENQEMIECLQAVSKHIQRFMGRSFPVDKYCFRKTERFFAQDNWLPLPIYELLYCLNYFYLLKGRNEYLEPIMKVIDRAIVDLQEGDHKDSPWHVDNYCLAVFLKGMCLAHMGYPLSAEEYFLEVVQNESNILKDRQYVSFALMELGYIAKDTGNYEQALEYFKAARPGSIFVTEFRIHQGIQELRRKGFCEIKDNQPEDFHYN